MVSHIGDRLLGKTNEHFSSLSENDTFRFYNLQQWYARSSWTTKIHFLRNILDGCDDPLFLFVLKKIFDGAYTKDVVHSVGENHLAFDVIPAEDNRYMDSDVLDRVVNKDTNWFNGLSKTNQIAVFNKLMLLGGIYVIIVISKHIHDLLMLNGKLPRLKDLIVEETDFANSKLKGDEIRTGKLLEVERVLSIDALDKNEVKITDSVYQEYVEQTKEWENKLNSFVQKYFANHRATEPSISNLVQVLPDLTTIPFCGELLNVHVENNSNQQALNKWNAEHIPLDLSQTSVSVAEYKNARNHIDLEIDRHLKKILKKKKSDNIKSGKNRSFENDLLKSHTDRIVKQSVEVCIQKKARTELLKRRRLIDGFDTKIIAMMPEMFCKDAQNYKMFPRSVAPFASNRQRSTKSSTKQTLVCKH